MNAALSSSQSDGSLQQNTHPPCSNNNNMGSSPFSTALDCLPQAVFLSGSDHCVAYCNPKFCELLSPEVKEADVLGRPWHLLVQANPSSTAFEELLTAVAQGHQCARAVDCTDAQGNWRVLHVSLKPLPTANPPAWMGMVEDITSSYTSDELHGLLASGINCLRHGISLVEVPAGPVDITPHAHDHPAGERQQLLQQLGRLLYANPALEQMSGQTLPELQAGGLASLLDPTSSTADITALVEALHSRHATTVKLVCTHKGSSVPCWTSISITPINQLPFTCAAWLHPQTGYASPMHDHYSRSNSREMPPGGLPNGERRSAELQPGAGPVGVSGAAHSQWQPGGTGDPVNAVDAAMLRLSALHHRPQNASTGSLLGLTSPHSTTHGTVHYLCVHEDITASVSQELSWQLRDHALSSCSEGITIADPSLPDAPLVYVNDAFLNMTGYSREDVIGRNCRFLQGANTSREAVTTLKAAVAAKSKATVELLNYRKDGEAFWNRLSITPVFNAAGELVSYIGVQSDVTELIRRKEEEQRLLEAKVAAENATEAKSMFLANMSHEIRTPLNGMMATAQLLLASSLNPEQRELAETVLESGNSLLGILGDILDFSKLDHGSITLTREPTDLRRSIESCIEIVAPDASKKGLMLYYTADDQALAQPLMADGIRLRQVLTNLLSNAVKFTERGEVHVNAWVEDAPAQEAPSSQPADTPAGSTHGTLSTVTYPPEAPSRSSADVSSQPANPSGRTSWDIQASSSTSQHTTGAASSPAKVSSTAIPISTSAPRASQLDAFDPQITCSMQSPSASSTSSAMHSCTSTGTLTILERSASPAPIQTILPPKTIPQPTPISLAPAITGAAITSLPRPPSVSQLPLLPLHVPTRPPASTADSLLGLPTFVGQENDAWAQAMQVRRFSLEEANVTASEPVVVPPLLTPQLSPHKNNMSLIPDMLQPRASQAESSQGLGSARRVHITVRDTGIGIPAELIGNLFQCFKQGSESMARKYGGTGLGLAISKRLSELMQGSVWVESEGKGKGCTFHFCLPADFSPIDTPAPPRSELSAMDQPGPLDTPIDLTQMGTTPSMDEPIDESDAWSGISRPIGTEGTATYASSTGSSSGGPGMSVSQGPFTVVSSEDQLVLEGRCVLIDTNHPGLSNQISQSCKQLGMQPRIGSACGITCSSGSQTPPERANTGSSLDIPSRSSADLPSSSSSSSDTVDLKADILVVSTDRAAAALKAGWKGRPVVAVGPRDLVSPNLWPLIVPCAVPVMHARLTTALIKSMVLLRWAPGRRAQGVKLTHQPISAAQMADFKSWRDRGHVGKLSAALLQSQHPQPPAGNAFRGQYVGGQLAVSTAAANGANGSPGVSAAGQQELPPGFAGGFGRSQGLLPPFDLARRSSLDNSSLERALVQQMMAATQARTAALQQSNSAGKAGAPPSDGKPTVVPNASHGHWRHNAANGNMAASRMPISIPENNVLGKIDEDKASCHQPSFKMPHSVGMATAPGTTTTNAPAASSAAPPQPPLRILIAEDNKVNQKVVLKVLQQISGSAQTEVVENGLEVLKAMERKTYDLILMDIHMPEMDGLEATRRIMATYPPAERPRIIALSADTLQDLHDKCREAGIEEFIVKPFRVEDLKRVMQTPQRRPSSAVNASAAGSPAPAGAAGEHSVATQPQAQGSTVKAS